MHRVYFYFLSLLLLLPGCASTKRQQAKFITMEEAESRAARVSEVHYDLTIKLEKEKEDFSGVVRTSFTLKNPSNPLSVDFAGGSITSLRVNGKEVSKPDYAGFFLSVPANLLKEGENTLLIGFSHPFSRTGAGFYRFKDNEDGRVYTYTDFEPYDSNQLFPNFDQPDIKAHYTLTVEAPENWVVVSSVKEAKIEPAGAGLRSWSFPRSAKFSTYIFSLHAGPYKIWESKAGSIPLRLLARQSFARYVNHKEWLKFTKEGFRFYEDYFDYPYPFSKYDQILVPDFNAGAMENVGAVTFAERLVPRGVPTQKERERISSIILHEMAHMWFGDLVTMKWWDDLWLNESFATYMAALAQAEGTEFKGAWKTFYARTKQWAYWEDGLVTTHPIVAVVPDTDQAFVNFDGITYGKGASSLKQLAYFLGPRNFRQGVRDYFKKYQWTNTVMNDFIGSLAAASKVSLDQWTKDWLMTPSHNTLEARFQCEGDSITSFALLQSHSDPAYKTLREHRTLVGLFGKSGKQVSLQKSVPVAYSGPQTPVPSLVGQPCPYMVYPNVGDNDFVKVTLDPVTLDGAKQSLAAVADPFGRMMLWQSLWDMVRDTKLTVWEYADLMFPNLPKEKDIRIVTVSAERMPDLLKYMPKNTEQEKKAREDYLARAEALLWSLLRKAKPGSDFQKVWFDTYVAIASSQEALGRLASVLEGKIRFPRFKVDQDRRWDIVLRLHTLAWPGADKVLASEVKRDKSEKGEKAALAATVSQPAMEVKRSWFSRIISDKPDMPLARLRVAMQHLFPEEQKEMASAFSEEYFTNLLRLVKDREGEFLTNFARRLTPAVCSSDSVDKLAGFISQHGTLTPLVMKQLRVIHQEDERCVKIRQRAHLGATPATTATGE